jgi:hypothetical protein
MISYPIAIERISFNQKNNLADDTEDGNSVDVRERTQQSAFVPIVTFRCDVILQKRVNEIENPNKDSSTARGQIGTSTADKVGYESRGMPNDGKT